MKNNKQKKHMISGKTKEEKRRLAFAKRNAKKERNVAEYGAAGGSALVVAKTADFNRRFVAAFLALVFAISCLVVGVNFAGKAADSDGFEMQTNEGDSLVLSKGIKNNGDGTYDLKLEAYATGSTATTNLDQDVPLDIVMVLDQSGSMLEKDVYGGYSKSTGTFNIEDSVGKYYLADDGEYYEVQLGRSDERAEAEDTYGNVIDSWTAEVAADAISRYDTLYFSRAVNDSEEVRASKDAWYKNAGTINVGNLTKKWNYNTGYESNYYYNSIFDISTNEPFWHKVYYNIRGETGTGYYYTFYYYVASETGSAVAKEAWHMLDYDSTWSTAKRNSVVSILGDGEEKYFASSVWPTQTDYTTGDLYTKQTSSSTYNSLWTTTNGSTRLQTLAWPLAGDTNSPSVQSGNYSGAFYAQKYKLYYVDNANNSHDIGTPVINQTRDDAYTGDLYTKKYISRLETLKSAAAQFAEAVGERAAEKGVDHRIAVVGFANNEIPCTSTYRDNIVDVDNGASEFITTNSGIFVNGNFKSYMTPQLSNSMTPISSTSYTNITYFDYSSAVSAYVPVNYNGSTWQQLRTDADEDTGEYYWWNNPPSPYYYPAITTISSQNYQDALVSITDNDSNSNNVNDYVDTALGKLGAYGETYMSYGLAMAGGVFENNSASNRKRIVVVFTDGMPGGGSSWDSAAANEALAASAKLKSKYDASVYTIGLYNEDPGTQVSNFMQYLSSEYYTNTTNVTGSSINSDTSGTYYFDDETDLPHSVTWLRSTYTSGYRTYSTKPKWTNTPVGDRTIPVTSNSGGTQTQAIWQDSNGWLRGAKWDSSDTRTGPEDNIWQFYEVNDPIADQSGTYYYQASDAESLNSIFTTISEAIQTPSTTVALGSDSILKDVVSDNFILPADLANSVTVRTYDGATSSTITSSWQDVSYAWDEDEKTLNVTGFDFSDKYIATGHSGERIVVTISGIILKNGAKTNDYDSNGFMKIPSNTSDSGIYKSADSDDLYGAFPIPYALVDPYATYKNGMMLSKRIALNNSNSYDLTLTAYSTGKTSSEQIPTDYVLVVDQSGSMSTEDVPTSYSSSGTTKNWKVSDGASTYYYKVTDDNGDDHYYRVYRKRGYMFEYHAKDTIYSGSCVSNLSWFQSDTDQDTGKASQYWYNPSQDTSGSRVGSSSDDRFYPITVSALGGVGYYGIRFRYTNIDGTSSYLTYPNQPYYKSPTGGLFGPGDRWGLIFTYNTCNATCKALTRNDTTQYTYGSFLGVNTGMYVRQVLFTRHSDYSQLAYKDDDGVEHILIDATYCNSSGTPVGGAVDSNGVPTGDGTSTTEAYWNGTLYTATNTITRLAALKASLKEFVETVASQGVEHRVAIAGFSSDGYYNTELLTGTDLTVSNNNGIQYDDLTTSNYQNALLAANSSTNATLTDGELTGGKLKEAIDALTANGGTEGEYGLYMAKNILDNRASTTAQVAGKEMDRLKIVVYFTDGTPGNYDYSNQYLFGNKVVDAAAKIKSSATLMDTEIYSIGTFGFADSEPLTYQKYSGTDNEYTYDADYVETYGSGSSSRYLYRIWLRNTKGYGDTATDTVSDYMRTISSEYPSATKFVDASWYGTGTKSDDGVYTDMVDRVRGSASGGRHYFLCTDLSSLSRTFTTVGSAQASAGAEYDATTILRDTIDGTKFDYSNATVSATVRMVDVNGATVSGTPSSTPEITTWENDKQISDTGVVEVKGVNYTGNFASAEQSGEQLVVTISGIKPLQTVTGDTVYSNTDNSGIYSSGTQVAPFAKPFITRHSYTLDVGSENTDATFTVGTLIVDENGDIVSQSDSSLSSVVLVYPNGTRLRYTTSGAQTFSGMGNTLPAFYYEGIPSGYNVRTNVANPGDSAYTYYLRYDSEGDSAKREMNTTLSNDFSFDNHVLNVTSVTNTQTVTIKETVSGEYANTDDTFTPIVYLIPPTGTTVPSSRDIGDYTWTKKDGDNNRLTTTLDPIKGDNTESIVLTIPTNWTIQVGNDAGDRYTTESYTVNDGTPSATETINVLVGSDTTILISNTSNPITITGVSDNDHFLPIWAWALIGVCLAAAACFYVLDKKKKKKV